MIFLYFLTVYNISKSRLCTRSPTHSFMYSRTHFIFLRSNRCSCWYNFLICRTTYNIFDCPKISFNFFFKEIWKTVDPWKAPNVLISSFFFLCFDFCVLFFPLKLNYRFVKFWQHKNYSICKIKRFSFLFFVKRYFEENKVNMKVGRLWLET